MADRGHNDRTDDVSGRTVADMELWQRLAHRELSEQEAREIRENLIGFFRLLSEWWVAEEKGRASRAGMPGTVRNDD